MIAFDLTHYWQSANTGRSMSVGEMDNQHVQNALNLIRRVPKAWRAEFIPRLKLELKRRGMEDNVTTIKGTAG